MNHLIVAPIVCPLVAGAVLLLLERRASRWVPLVALVSTLVLGAIAIALLQQAAGGGVQAYLLGNWRAPYGVALALDRTSALLVALTAAVGLGALLYAIGGNAAARGTSGLHFHALFQFQLMGLNGAFLTADLFNLFVFFEVLLAASYGLLLHGGDAGRRRRLEASVHYVIFNLAGSALFLIAVSLLYGIAGTLNMADLALELAQLPPENLRLAQSAALMLLVVFAVKAALLPLYFWLPKAYASATAPAAALFAVLTKVGVYSIARVATLVFGMGSGAATLVPPQPLPLLALATLALAAVGALAARRLSELVAYLVVASAGTLMLAVGLATPASLGAGLFYLVNSTLVVAAWFLLTDRIGSGRSGTDRLVPAALGSAQAWAPLGGAFLIAAVAAAGMPPLAGFVGKAMLLQAAGHTPWGPWAVTIVLGSSLAVMVALGRAGSVLFWESARPAPMASAALARPAPALQRTAVTLLLAAVVGCAVAAGPLARYTAAAGAQLFDRRAYVDAVLGAAPVPPAYDVRREMRERGEAK